MIDASHRYPAEFESHSATWLLWPLRPDNWRENAHFAQDDILALAGQIARFEPVRLGVPADHVLRVKNCLPQNVRAVPLSYDDIWVRDTGPTILVSDSRPAVAVDWRFNSWGGLFSESSSDDAVAASIAKTEGILSVRAPIVLEGGAIVTDGCGTLIATEESVLADNRNPGLSRREAEDVFRNYLNISNVIWLPRGLANDESGGHVDNVCAFASERVLLVSSSKDEDHPSHERLGAVWDILRTARNIAGDKIELVELPLPPATEINVLEAKGFAAPSGAIRREAGCQLAPSHINFYIANGAVFMPKFNSPTDATALDILKRTFVGRVVIPLDSREFLLGGGAIHCATKEIPK